MIIQMELGKDSYDIVLERGALDKAGSYLDLQRRVLVVTDDGVPEAYAESIAEAAKEGYIHRIPQGEASKNFDSYRAILKDMLEHSFTRKDCVVAVGGGVVGDLAGFAAASYMRGVDFYNIPTTLLSQVDSSIGGKTAIDLDGVKNIVGAFYQPKKVIIDPDTLRTLDKRQLHAGLVEAVKMAATCDRELFDYICASDDLGRDLEHIIEGALRIKKYVVEQDPKESGLRKVLNFGHTIGHAIESFYAGKYLHGECVAMGMLPMCAEPVREKLKEVLGRYGVPLECSASAQELMPYLLHDKKSSGNTISVIYVPEAGRFEMSEMEPARIAEMISVG